jgi:TolB-like protein/Tfp pilus assembly protein PilF
LEFFKELRRRKVIRVAVVYVVTAWVLIQVADVVADPLRLPDWFSTSVIVLLALGFPVALGLAWALEVRPESGGNEPASAQSGTADDDADRDDESEPYLITRRSVAVLPFENVSSDVDVTHIATGLTEEILNNLSSMQDLKVASRSSTLAYKDANIKATEIGEELGVSYLVEGSIRKLGEDLRITTQLIRAPDDEHLWAQTFERDLSEGFAMQEQLAQVIARQVQANMQTDVAILAARRQTQSPRAYRYFRIAAEERWQEVSGDHSPDYKLVLENYRRAVELDPNFAVAHEGIANICPYWFWLDLSRGEASRIAHEALEQAMALHPPSAFTYLNLVLIYTNVDANYPAARKAIEQGLALAPNMSWLRSYLGWLALRQGFLDDARKHVRTALNLAPGDGQTHFLLGELLWERGDRTGAIGELEKSLENMRGGAWFVARTAMLAMVYLEDGRTERANDLLDAAMRSLQGDTGGLAALCLALAQAGRTSDLQTVTKELVSAYGERWFPGRYAMHLAANEIDEAFRQLNEGIEQRYTGDVMWLRSDHTWLAPLREDPRWQEVMTHLEAMEARGAAGE